MSESQQRRADFKKDRNQQLSYPVSKCKGTDFIYSSWINVRFILGNLFFSRSRPAVVTTISLAKNWSISMFLFPGNKRPKLQGKAQAANDSFPSDDDGLNEPQLLAMLDEVESELKST